MFVAGIEPTAPHEPQDLGNFAGRRYSVSKRYRTNLLKKCLNCSNGQHKTSGIFEASTLDKSEYQRVGKIREIEFCNFL